MGNDGRRLLPFIASASNATSLALIFTLYLAPTKHFAADFIVTILLLIALAVFGRRRSNINGVIRPLAPLLFMALYAVALDFYGQRQPGYAFYIRELLIGFAPFMLLYVIFRNQRSSDVTLLTVAVFFFPGFVHLTLMYWDIFLSIAQGQVPFSAGQGWLEYIKETPRVGRRYLSMALLHLACGTVLIAWYLRHSPTKYWVWGLSSICVLSLALLDARAAYVSVIIGGALLLMVTGPTQAWKWPKTLLLRTLDWKIVRGGLVCLVVGAIVVGYSAGKSRWVSMSYSFKAAAYDVFDSNEDLAERPYVSQAYWSAPIEDAEKCFSQGDFRCKVDQSAYLRMAWLLSGLKSVVNAPLGIGYTDDYMARLWNVAGQDNKYQKTDSLLVELMVTFGVPGILLYCLFFGELMRTCRGSVVSGKATAAIVLVCGIILVCAARGLIDTLSEGLWRYLMALAGMFYGVVHSNELRTRN